MAAPVPCAALAEPQEQPATQPPDEEEVSEDIELLALEVPTVVTAARREQKLSHISGAVSVITNEDIRRSGARTVPDALRLVPGVDVADLTSGSFAVSARGMHGFAHREMLVLVDGRQIFDSLFGGTVWGSWPFQLEDIQRIEVVRGPGGVTWGANAVNGVVNIITKDPRDQLGLTLTAGGGSRGWHKEHLGYAMEDGKLRLRVSGEYEASDGFLRGGSFLRTLEDDYKNGRSAIHGIYDAGENDTVTFSAGNSLMDGGYAPAPLAGVGLTRNPGSQASFLLGKWQHRIAEHNSFDLTGYVNDFQASSGLPAVDFRYQQFAFQFSHTFRPSENHTVDWGIDSRADLLDATNSDPFLLSKGFVGTGIIGLYGRDEWRFAPRWVFDLGGRIDYELYGGFQPSARAGLSYELTEDSLLYAAVSRAFQMPPAGARFVDIPLLNGLARTTGDQSLEAETLNAYELGYHGRLFKRLDTSLDLYWHEYNGLTTLDPLPGPPGLLQMHLDNTSEASVFGAELELKYAVTERLTLLGHYTYQEMKWDSDVPFVGTDAMTLPAHKFMLAARYAATDDLHLSAQLHFVDAVRAPNPSNPFLPMHIREYFRLDLRAEHEFWNDRASLAVGVTNLLDETHPEGGTLFLNDAEVPRMIYAELRIAIAPSERRR